MQTVTSLQNSGQLKRRRIYDQSDVVHYILHVHDRDIQSVPVDCAVRAKFLPNLVHMWLVGAGFTDIFNREGAQEGLIRAEFLDYYRSDGLMGRHW